jgi:hypothetical protein
LDHFSESGAWNGPTAGKERAPLPPRFHTDCCRHRCRRTHQTNPPDALINTRPQPLHSAPLEDALLRLIGRLHSGKRATHVAFLQHPSHYGANSDRRRPVCQQRRRWRRQDISCNRVGIVGPARRGALQILFQDPLKLEWSILLRPTVVPYSERRTPVWIPGRQFLDGGIPGATSVVGTKKSNSSGTRIWGIWKSEFPKCISGHPIFQNGISVFFCIWILVAGNWILRSSILLHGGVFRPDNNADS